MSKIDVTTQDLLRRLGPTSRSRSTKADAVFRRLRMEQSDQIADALQRAPRSFPHKTLSDAATPPSGDHKAE